jgi:hypothetical protein
LDRLLPVLVCFLKQLQEGPFPLVRRLQLVPESAIGQFADFVVIVQVVEVSHEFLVALCLLKSRVQLFELFYLFFIALQLFTHFFVHAFQGLGVLVRGRNCL